MPGLVAQGMIDGVTTDGEVTARFADITDGASNTLMVGERPPSLNYDTSEWYPAWVAFTQSPAYVSNVALSVDLARTINPYGCEPSEDVFRFGPGRIDNPCDKFHFWSLHGDGGNFLFADASIHFLAFSAQTVLPALASRAGGEVVDLPF